MFWVTRERPKTDRIACPWLIRRFIDLDAEFVFAPAKLVSSEAYRLGGDPVLVRLARIVHAADMADDLNTDPQGAAFLASGIGSLAVEDDDHVLLDRAVFVHDALYEWCRRDIATDDEP
jgi:hypothetical protein